MTSWILSEIVAETGVVLNETLGDMLKKYVCGKELYGRAFQKTVQRMEESKGYSDYVISFYKHCYDSATTVYEMNKIK